MSVIILIVFIEEIGNVKFLVLWQNLDDFIYFGILDTRKN